MEITRTTAHWEVKTKTKNEAVVVLVVLVIVAIADVIYMPLGETACWESKNDADGLRQKCLEYAEALRQKYHR